MDGSGTAHLAFTDSSSNLYVARRVGERFRYERVYDSDGLTSATSPSLAIAPSADGWSEAAVVDAEPFINLYALTLDGSGGIYVAYERRDLRAGTQHLAFREPDGTWSAIELGPLADAEIRSLAVDSAGDVHALATSGFTTLLYAVRREGAWTTTVIEDSSHPAATRQSLALDAQGRPHLAYTRGGDGAGDDLVYARLACPR